MCVLPDDAKADIVCGAIVCRQHATAGILSPVTQFGEQTAFVFGKRALNGMDLSDELEREWIVIVHVSDHVDHITVMIDQFSLLRNSAGGSEAPVYL